MRRKSYLYLCGVALGVAMLPSFLGAHAMLQKSDPAQGSTLAATPPRLRLWFNEKVDLAVSVVQMTGPMGRIDLGKPQSPEPQALAVVVIGNMVDGPYKVTWQTAGVDGHVEKGAFTFVLKRAH
jgi:methionine-rich copper-binding protein CopC